MAKETKNLGLYLEDDSGTKFKDWRDKINGPTGSNMEKIDTAVASKQDKLTGQPGQVVGFDKNGNVQAQTLDYVTMVPITIPKGRSLGDVDGDGEITQADTLLIMDAIVGEVELDDISRWCADADGDGIISINDQQCVRDYIKYDYCPNGLTDYYNNWTYDTDEKIWETSIPSESFVAGKSAVVCIPTPWKQDTFVGVEVLDGALVIRAKSIPIDDVPCQVILGKGDGTAIQLTSGATGADATINGVNALTLQAGDGLDLTQSGSTATISLNSDAKAAVEALKKSLGGSLPSTTLASNTPAVIQKVAAAGLGANFWSVGDKVGIALSGTVGELAISGTYYAFIIGFNHNSGIEGLGIQFQFGKDSSGKDIAFVHSKHNTTGSDAAYRMNTTNTNTGGWASSYMRNTICPAFLAALPAAWQNVIAPCTKYTDNVGGGNGNVAANITATVDKIFNLSEQEVFGAITNGNTYEANYQKQYEYYANGNSKVKYRHNSTGSACGWWLRSVDATSTTFFRYVHTDGSVHYNAAYNSYGFAPGFKVA